MSNRNGALIEVVKPIIAAFVDTPLRDPRLSWRAKGIAAYLLGKPPGWQIWTNDLVHRSSDGRDSVLAGLRELEEYGYLKRERSNGNGGRLQWRKTMSATPDTMWADDGDPPSTENPVMVESPSTALPYTVEPSTVEPSTVNPTHSISDISISDLSSSDSREEKTTAAPSEEEAAQPPIPEPEGLAIVRRVLEDCHIKAAPEAVYGYSTVAHIIAEAVRWWDETPAHKRSKNGGLLIYRIKTNEYQPLTQYEIARCTPHYRWLNGDAVEPTQPELPIPQPMSAPRPKDAWTQFVDQFAAERFNDSLAAWLAECESQWDGDTLTVTPRTDEYLEFMRDRMTRRLRTDLAFFAGRPVTICFAPPSRQVAV